MAKGSKKLKRSGRKKAYYARQFTITARNKARRALRRERQINAAIDKRVTAQVLRGDAGTVARQYAERMVKNG
jgi:hypothetical protein